MNTNNKRVAISVDLGTGNSCTAVIENGKPVVVANSEGKRTTPSVVSLKNGERKVGESANRQRIINPMETIYNIKRFMGNDYDACSEIISRVPYKVNNVGGKPRIEVEGKEYSPEEISSFILNKMKKTAEDYLGEAVTDAVITCPAWFDNAAREATKLAGEMCGLNVLRIINEPTAAILASSIVTSNKSQKVMVADIGCGTTDFSICDISDGVVEVLASKGDVFLGGSDFDNAISQWLIDSFKSENGIDLSKDKQALSRIIEAAEKAKIELSSSTSTDINLPYITVKDGTPIHLTQTITRAKLEQLTVSLVDKIVKCGEEALKAANLDRSDLDCILLVGGQSRSLAIQEALSKTFGVELNKSVNPDEAVAEGAAIQANTIIGGSNASDILLLDVTPLTLGIETMGGVMTTLVEANTTIPCERKQIFTTASANQTSVQIHVLQGERAMAKDNKSLGIFSLDGIMPAPRGVPRIEVSFSLDANSILTVSATDKATGKEQHITIQNNNSLSQEEIDRIKQEAKEHEAEDKKVKDQAEKQNRCESLIYQTEQGIKEHETMLTQEDKDFFNGKIEELNNMKKNSDYNNLSNIENDINNRWYGITSKAYGNNSQQTSGSNQFDNFAQNFTQNTNEHTSANTSNPTDDGDAEVQDAK